MKAIIEKKNFVFQGLFYILRGETQAKDALTCERQFLESKNRLQKDQKLLPSYQLSLGALTIGILVMDRLVINTKFLKIKLHLPVS